MLQTKYGNISYTKEIKYLGVNLQDNLQFTNHIDYIVTKLNIINNIIFKMRLLVSQKTLIKMYYALAYPHIIYCITNWALTYKTKLNRVKIAINNILRTISFVNRKDHIHIFTLYNNLKLQNLTQIIATRILIEYAKFDKTTIKHNYNTRNKSKNNVILKQYNTNKGKNTFSNVASKLYNLLPTEIKDKEHTNNYKILIKRFIDNTDEQTLNKILYE